MKRTIARLEHQNKHDIEYGDLKADEKDFINFMLPQN